MNIVEKAELISDRLYTLACKRAGKKIEDFSGSDALNDGFLTEKEEALYIACTNIIIDNENGNDLEADDIAKVESEDIFMQTDFETAFEELRKQVKGWEKQIDRILKDSGNEFLSSDIGQELDSMSNDMMGVNLTKEPEIKKFTVTAHGAIILTVEAEDEAEAIEKADNYAGGLIESLDGEHDQEMLLALTKLRYVEYDAVEFVERGKTFPVKINEEV